MRRLTRRRLLRTAGLVGLAGVGAPAVAGTDQPATPEEHWRFETGAAVGSSPTVVGGIVFVGSWDRNVYALDAASGDERWRFGTGGLVGSSPTVVDGTVFVGSDDARVHALDAATGEEQWHFETDLAVSASPTVADDTVVAASLDSVYALDAATGEVRWHFSPGDMVVSSPTVVDGTIYVGSWDEHLHALDLTTGEQVWSFDAGAFVESSPTVADDTVFVGDRDGFVYALVAGTGEEQWRYDTHRNVASSPTVAGGTVYVRDGGDDLFALEAATGQREWRAEMGGPGASSPTVAGDAVFVGAGEYVHAFDAATGDERWRFEAGDAVHSSPTVVDGTVFVGSEDANVYAIDAGVDGSSEGSRVLLGTLGHHHAWTGDHDQTIDVAGSGGVIENLRLVQTVENTRALVPRDEREGTRYGQEAPVAADLVLDHGHEDIAWSAPEPPFVTGRRLAPVFDLAIGELDSVDEPATVSGRLIREGETLLERTATVAPAALRGQDDSRRNGLRDLYNLDVPDRLPLLEMLAENPDLIDGEYPTLPAFGECDVEVEVESPMLEESVTETVSIDPDRTERTRTLTIGVVPLEKDAITDEGSYHFDDDPDVMGYTESVAQYVLDTYPVTDVEMAVHEEPIEGPSANVLGAPQEAVLDADRALGYHLDTATTFKLSDDGIRLDDVGVGKVDVTIGVLPVGEFFDTIVQRGLSDSDRDGTMPNLPFRGPVAPAVLAEIGDPVVAAHEIGHYFLGYHFDDPAIAEDGSDEAHATQKLRSSGYAHRNGSLDVRPAQTSVMHDSGEQWMDAHTYRGLVDSDFGPYDTWSSPEPATSHDASTAGHLAEADRLAGTAHEVGYEGDDVDIEGLRSTIATLRGGITDGLAATDAYWEVPDALDPEQWEQLRAVGADLTALGDELAAGENELLVDAATSTDEIGARLADLGGALESRAETRRSDGLSYVLEVTGEITSEFEVEYQTLPVVGEPKPIDGDGSIEVRDADGEVLAAGGIATEVEFVGQNGGRGHIDGAALGAVEVPADAATVELSAEGETGTVTTSIDPTTGPTVELLEALPDRAFADDSARSGALDDLDRVGELVADGDREDAAERLQSLYRDLHAAIPEGYEPESADEPTRDDVLARVGQQIQRFGGEVPRRDAATDAGLPAEWLVAGAGGVAVGGYALTRYYRDGRDDAPTGR